MLLRIDGRFPYFGLQFSVKIFCKTYWDVDEGTDLLWIRVRSLRRTRNESHLYSCKATTASETERCAQNRCHTEHKLPEATSV